LLKQNKSNKAVDVFLEGSEYGMLQPKGALMVHDLVGVACTGVACNGLYAACNKIPVENIPDIIATIKKFEIERDPVEDFLYRDRVWSQHAYGWYGHLLDILSDYFETGWDSTEAYVNARARELAILRLLQLELALRLYEHDHGRHPDSLDALVPKYIEGVPVDAMSPEGAPLRSIKTEIGVVPYSIGYNGIDDQGQADLNDPTFGDLRLDVLWGPEPTVSQTTVGLPNDEDELEFEAELDEPD
jgi:hypothetical protein